VSPACRPDSYRDRAFAVRKTSKNMLHLIGRDKELFTEDIQQHEKSTYVFQK